MPTIPWVSGGTPHRSDGSGEAVITASGPKARPLPRVPRFSLPLLLMPCRISPSCDGNEAVRPRMEPLMEEAKQ